MKICTAETGFFFPTYVLVASICKYNDWKNAQGRNKALPFNKMNWATVSHGVSLDEVGDNQNDKISDRDQGDNTSIFQRV